MAQRDFYIDRLRSVMTVLVILHHTAITYGAPGGWFWTELKPSGTPASLLLTLFVTTNQAYFMGFFFLLAGYFTPASLERKGYARFIGDRFLRLGLPLLAFGLLLGPLTAAIVNYAQGDGFRDVFVALWRRREFINGPLWFAQALLIFSLGYCVWRALAGFALSRSERTTTAVPAGIWWLVSAFAVGAAGLAIRQFVPVGKNVFGLQLAYFAGYIFLFAIGIAAWRYDWLRQLSWKNARAGVIAAAIAWPLMPAAIALALALNGPGKSNFAGGFTWPAIVYALWDPFVAWGLIAAWLLVFRAYMNQPSGFSDWLNRRAYAVYIIHPPMLVGIALLLHGWAAPALIKFGVVGLLACTATWLISDPLVRLPGLRRVV
jgi:fucose 4-O-acetylase-like acetyltransferase